MKIDILLQGMFICSIIISLMSEGIKKTITKNIASNTTVLIVSIIVSIITYYIYTFYNNIQFFDISGIIHLTVLIFGNWLTSMLGYDKVIQTLSQIRKS